MKLQMTGLQQQTGGTGHAESWRRSSTAGRLEHNACSVSSTNTSPHTCQSNSNMLSYTGGWGGVGSII